MSRTQDQLRFARGPLVILIGFLPVMAIASMTTSMPVMIDHFARGGSCNSFLVPLVVTAPALMIAILAPFAGQLIDRFGRQRPLVVACLIYGVAGCAPLALDSLVAVVASRLVLGVAEAVLITVSATLIADYWNEAGRRFWLTIQGIAGPFLSSGVIAASGYLSEGSWNGVFHLYLLAFPLALGCWFLLPDPKRPEQETGPAPDRAPYSPWIGLALPVLAGTAFAAVLYYVWIVQGGLAFREVGIEAAGRQGEIFALAHLAVILGSFLFWFTSRLLSTGSMVALMLATMGIGLVLIGMARDENTITLGLIVQQTAAGMCVPTLLIWAQRVLPHNVRGRGLGAWSACFFAGQFISPLLFASAKLVEPAVLDRFVIFGAIATAFAVAILLVQITGLKMMTGKSTREDAA